DRLLTLGSVDDQIDLVILDHVHNVRPTLPHLVYPAAGDSRFGERPRRSLRGEKLEAAFDELARKPHRTALIAVPHTDEAYAVTRQGHARSGLGLGICLAERPPSAHHLARRLHFRT